MEFTNSSLASYVRISPNCNSPRNQNIEGISIHCMAGDLSIETCGNLFADPARQASSNYGIGSDGRIGLYVEEKNRTWCTSSKDNDHRVVTIEVANCSGSPDWKVTDAAYRSLVALCTDICIRNDIKSLKWLGDKNLIGNMNAQNMTVHRWFAAKACPGDYLYNLHGQIASEVNYNLEQIASGEIKKDEEGDIIIETGESSDVNQNSSDNELIIWTFLKSKGLSDYAVAGIMGNLFSESSLQPNNLQNSYESKLGFTDATYTAAVDNGSYTNFVRDSAGYGLAQWTYWSRKEGLLNYAKKLGKSIADINVQLEYLWDEMESSFKAMLTSLKAATSIREASDIILTQYEKPANQGESVKVARANYSTHFYNLFATADVTDDNASVSVKFPYTVRVTCSALNIRSGPGTNYSKTGKQICDRGIYTIIAESTGSGASIWGQLKSGAGWISLDYTKKT